ncbi:ABC transporter substrate-binding protein [Pseudovibrio sp. Ad26]|uniref:ABC transporter substrate-binding protein n=1 Tax=Pseudovibrio sp. Ad26 TaxID=989410 RepID=UPI0007AE4E4E|nr:ABC transporter substrate-binding protein [Pseudovibrio sp. Ad26]
MTTMSANAQDLRIGLQSDADVLDPDQSRSFVGRIVYASLCDKLVDITPDLEIIPQLATSWSWTDGGKKLTFKLREDVIFHDGTPFNAQAVARNITRSQTLPESRRKSEVSSIESTSVLSEYEIAINLKKPDSTLLAQLADRSGMMVSPDAAEARGTDFGLKPVCSGAFEFVERVAQDRIVLKKFDSYWNKDAINFDTVTYLPIPDNTVRLANLLSGDIHILDRLAATDLKQAEQSTAVNVNSAVSLGYQGLTMNVGNGERANTPWGQDKRVRQALSYSIDRHVLNNVVFNGAFAAGNQAFPPNSPWYDNSHPIPERDVAKAKALLAEAGYTNGLELEISVPNTNVPTQVTQVIQAMAAEAGINVKLVTKEFATLLADDSAGNYQASQIGWSGRVDPDGNIHQFVTIGGGINDSGYSNAKVDELLNLARQSADQEERKLSYIAANKILQDELPIIYLYHQTWIWGLTSNLKGFAAYPDGMIRLEGVSFQE